MSAIAIERCPFPGCALELEHDGDHVPALHLVQRYNYSDRWTIRCEIGDCQELAAAMYSTHDGKATDVCAYHEREFVMSGQTQLLQEGAA